MTTEKDILDAACAAALVGAFHVTHEMFREHKLDRCPVCFEPFQDGHLPYWIIFRGHNILICYDCVHGPCAKTSERTVTNERNEATYLEDYTGQVHYRDGRSFPPFKEARIL